MSDNNRELARLWFRKAQNDLIAARQILVLDDGPTDTVAFHVQQTVEKALKALLTLKGVQFPKTHDLVRLLDLAGPGAGDLQAFREEFADLSNYAVEIRYPGDWSDPAREEVEDALQVAEDVVKRVADMFPESPEE